MYLPYGLKVRIESPEISTRWRTVADHKNQLYFSNPHYHVEYLWVNLKKLIFQKRVGEMWYYH